MIYPHYTKNNNFRHWFKKKSVNDDRRKGKRETRNEEQRKKKIRKRIRTGRNGRDLDLVKGNVKRAETRTEIAGNEVIVCDGDVRSDLLL